MAHPSAVQTEPVSMSAQIATMNDVANIPTKNCGKYMVARTPLKEPAAPFAKRRGRPYPIYPPIAGVGDATGIADSAIAVPVTVTHYGTPTQTAQDGISD